MAKQEAFNLAQGLAITNAFHFLLSSGKACLLPFLTLYLRQLGLSATQTGLIFGVKAFTGSLFAPLWLRFAKKFRKKRLTLMFAIFVLIGSNLGLTLVPPVDQEDSLMYCPGWNGTVQYGMMNNTSGMVNNTSNHNAPHHLHVSTTNRPGVKTSLATTNIPTHSTWKPSKTSIPAVSHPDHGRPTRTSTASTPAYYESSTTTPVTRRSTVSTTERFITEPIAAKSSSTATSSKTYRNSRYTTTTTPAPVPSTISPLAGISEKLLRRLHLAKAMLGNLTRAELIEKLRNAVLSQKIYDQPEEDSHIQKRDMESARRGISQSLDTIKAKMKEWKQELYALKYRTFIIVMIVVVLGEVFATPVYKMADEYWFEVLDSMDDLELYGHHHTWSSLGYGIFAIIVSAIVDNTDCLLNNSINHFMIHFYLFASVLSIAFLLAIFLPVYQSEKAEKKSHVYGSVTSLFSDVHCFAYALTAFIAGLIYAGISNFLFWLVEDKGGMEIVMGVAVAVASFSEIPHHFFSKYFIKRVTHSGVVSIGIALLAVRLLYLSFLWTPWAAVPVEIVHGFCYTSIFLAIFSYSDFKVSPNKDRCTQAVFHTIYHGMGFSLGSCLSGLVYDTFGLSILYQGSCLITIVWCIIFVIVQKCFKKQQKVRYFKLLQGDEDELSDTSANYEDDWLEIALKDDMWCDNWLVFQIIL